ncbi:MAG: HAMP domain-containing histidine kinase [Gemmatimonadetes bacterium]|nr:HAMP domain-containing histidine kinase [Gemmatimonadota bacterium]NNK62343.1 HAMP domain-containing histidine kinase [Gemmatimonadota bacterium]
MRRERWPLVLATLFLILLGWYLVYTRSIGEALEENAETLTEIFAEVQRAITDPDPFRSEQALSRLQDLVLETDIPIVLTGEGGRVTAVENLPFEADLLTPEGQGRLREYVVELDLRNPPIGEPGDVRIHFGDPPIVRRLGWISSLQAGGLLLTVLVGLAVIRAQRRADSERAWTAMARELAHQLGTPISSLQGWLEVLRLGPHERPGSLGEGEVADAIAEDLVRLERISHRFELIGREPELTRLSLHEVVGELERYLQARLPRLGRGIELNVDVPADIAPILGNAVLLAWALENVVKNALDALAGRGGEIDIRAFEGERDRVVLQIRDTGPGVEPEVRDKLFEPGVTTKSGGWGVGLALSRRIVEGVHRGRIELLDERPWGATFEVRLPRAPDVSAGTG